MTRTVAKAVQRAGMRVEMASDPVVPNNYRRAWLVLRTLCDKRSATARAERVDPPTAPRPDRSCVPIDHRFGPHRANHKMTIGGRLASSVRRQNLAASPIPRRCFAPKQVTARDCGRSAEGIQIERASREMFPKDTNQASPLSGCSVPNSNLRVDIEACCGGYRSGPPNWRDLGALSGGR